MSVPARSKFLIFSHLVSLLFLGATVYPFLFLFPEEPWNLGFLMLAATGFQVGLLRTRRLASRTHAPEVFYLSFFLILSSGELFRIWFLWLKEFPQWVIWQVPVLRAVYFFRLAATLTFFLASLYPLGWRYKRSSRIGFFIIAVSLLLVGALPVNTNLYQPNGLYVVGEETLFQSLLVALHLLTLASRISTVARQQVRENAVATLALAVFSPSYLLLFYGWEWLATPLLVASGTFFLGRLKKEYEWS